MLAGFQSQTFASVNLDLHPVSNVIKISQAGGMVARNPLLVFVRLCLQASGGWASTTKWLHRRVNRLTVQILDKGRNSRKWAA